MHHFYLQKNSLVEMLLYKACEYDIPSGSFYEHRPFSRTSHDTKLFVVTEDGPYFATHRNVIFNSSKIAKFRGRICHLKSLKNIVASADDRGSIKVMKERVLRRYEMGVHVLDMQFVGDLKIATIGVDNVLRIYDLQEEVPILTKQFSEKLVSIACCNGLLALGSEKKTVILNAANLEEQGTLSLAGRRLFFVGDNKIGSFDCNKISVFDTESGILSERRVHRKQIKSVEVKDGFIYSLGRDSLLKKLDPGLCILVKEHVRDVVAYSVSDRIYILKRSGEVFFIEDIHKEDSEDKGRYNCIEKMVKKYEYKKSILEALNNNSMRRFYGVLKYLVKVGGMKQALSDHDLDNLSKILKVVNENWSRTELVEINIAVSEVVARSYTWFYHDLWPLFNELERNIDTELLFQEECYAIYSFIECILE